ncbi:MAG: hypothetical protein H6835_07340 [Planctomycetes bacterium]|nr:hypothetical protein [Planctomycetota bacterium]
MTNRGDFIVLSTEPVDNAQLFLNDAVRIDFNHAVDLDSVDLTTFTFQVFDQIGNQVAEPVAGDFSVGTSPGDKEPGRRLLFTPRLPTNDQFTNGGFRPGRVYQVQLVGGNRHNGTVLRDTSGRALALPRTFQFSTSDGTSPAQLFRNTAPGGPRRASFEITPTPETTGVVLNKLGGPPLELRLNFDQPLNPSSVNIPVAVETDPVIRNSNNRGRVFLEYDDPVYGNNWWIPADAELEGNEVTGATLVLRPLGVLPNNATVRVIVERTLEDISGESNVANVAFDRQFATFTTRRAYEQQFAGLVDDFAASSQVDLTAAFSEPFADVGPGYLKAGFAFEGSVTGADFEPSAPETILNTDFTLVTPKNGAPFNVSGGVFNFRNVVIPAGKTVKGQGTKPMVWLVSGSFEVSGTLSVRGGDGVRVLTSGTADSPKAGGAGACGGGDGGDGSPSSTQRDIAGGTGNGPLQVANRGGVGGTLSCTAGCNRGSGGGGGSLATQGDPNYKLTTIAPGTAPPNNDNVFPIFPQQTGIGGQGCVGLAGTVTRVLEGGTPGPTVFTDARNDNNFWGVGVRYDTNLRITGELSVPIGGGGGGGGGDLSYNSDCSTAAPNFETDKAGGGGGGGGGVLIVKALGPIIVNDTGHVVADGGSGGGGEPSASSGQGGGGGGGAGGMVVLMSATRIDLYAHGTGSNVRYAAPENNYDFCISADGGVCVTGATPPIIAGKYPSSGQGTIPSSVATTYDSVPLGGYGGMGIVQLMAPPGDNSDLTNTVLDDNIRVFEGAGEQTGTRKRDILAWRGFPNGFGQGVDDSGTIINPTNAANEGDIRPAPVLLPTPFASKSRLRSRWIDTGATARRYLGSLTDDNQPRGLVAPSSTDAGPKYEWQGVLSDSGVEGYADYTIAQAQAQTVFQQVVAPTTILSRSADSTFLGRPAYRVRLTAPAMGTINDRFVQYEAELLDTDLSVLGSYRILSHTADELVLSTESGVLDTVATRVRVLAKFFDLVTNELPGLGSTYSGSGGQRVPVANVRIGFAFHTDPQNAAAPRLPAEDGTFLYDLYDPATQEAVRALGAQFVQWDITFDTAFRRSPADVPPALNPETPRPELHFLRLPFRF